ncbi:winged helix-turn-helix domain-containing protein [Desulfococcaceae bacterium HSG7]|nr:winged helix-turn-helix domain-containing protein [Desulfococcaceae bacterium HSG7]
MKADNYKFTADEIQNIKICRNNQKDTKMKLRLIALLMLQGGNVKTVASILGFVPLTIENRFQKYMTGRVDELITCHYKSKKTKLNFFQINQVIIQVTYSNPDNTKEVMNYISEKFGVDYCPESVRRLLVKHGLKCIRPKVIPGNPPSVEEQRRFIENIRIMKATSEPGTEFLFGDGMHLIHQNLSGFCQGDPLFPPVLETDSSR